MKLPIGSHGPVEAVSNLLRRLRWASHFDGSEVDLGFSTKGHRIERKPPYMLSLRS